MQKGKWNQNTLRMVGSGFHRPHASSVTQSTAVKYLRVGINDELH